MSENVLAALPQALFVADENLTITYANPAAEDLFSQSASQLLGRSIAGWPVFDDAFATLCQRALSSGEALSLFDQTLYFLQGEIPVTIHLAPFDAQLLLTFEKNDNLQKLAGQNAKKEAARAAGVMAAMLAHEVKNPLSGIRGAAQLLKSDITPEQQPLTDLICNEVDRIAGLLNQVEIFTAGTPELAPVNIHEALQYVMSIAKAGFAKHVTFIEKYDPSLPPVSAHRDLLVQMLLNLIKNAGEALAQTPNPTITLTTHYQSGYRQQNTPLPIAIDIEDNGPGIAEELRHQLFEPFLSSKDEGRGLGLAVVAKIAGDIGASVELAQKQGVGAKFTVRLAVA